MAESSVWSSWTMSGHRNTYPNALFTPNFMVAQARSQSCTETSPSWNLFSGTEWFVIQNTVHDRTPLSPYTSERANFSDSCLAREAVHHFWYMTQHLFSQTIPTTVHTQPPWGEEGSQWWEPWLHSSHNETDPRAQIHVHPTHPNCWRFLYLADNVPSWLLLD